MASVETGSQVEGCRWYRRMNHHIGRDLPRCATFPLGGSRRRRYGYYTLYPPFHAVVRWLCERLLPFLQLDDVLPGRRTVQFTAGWYVVNRCLVVDGVPSA